MLTSVVLLLIAYALLAYLWDDIRREEATEKYKREVAEITARKERVCVSVRGDRYGHSDRKCM